MPKSMTGFGRGECTRHNRKFRIEMKSVNHRFSDFSIRIPRFLAPFEERIRSRLAKDIVRGKTDMWINFESFAEEDMKIHINTVYADSYMKVLWDLSKRYGIGDPDAIALELLAKTPDVIVHDRYDDVLDSEAADEIWEGLADALDKTLAQFNYMRETEGEALVRDISENYIRSKEIIREIRKLAPRASEDYAARLKERVKDLLDKAGENYDDSRVLTEIALLADKSDINEEMTRLESHLSQLAEMIHENGAIGRKMDFLTQELNREANTIGAKSHDVLLTKSVVELKSLIEKIREQVQNIE